MAINFPDSPTHGQSATLAGKSFTYDSDVSGWNVGSSSAANSTTVSATAPSNPNSGDNWFDTTDAALNIYYNDGSSSQWVEIGGSGAAGAAGASGAATSYANLAAFPSSGNTAGDLGHCIVSI